MRALALSGLERHDDALWTTHVALAMDPRMSGDLLAEFGALGQPLVESPVPAALVAGLDAGPDPGERPPGEATVTAPKLLKPLEIDYPRAGRALGAQGPVIIQVEISSAGEPSRPRILSGHELPAFDYAALEALRQARFKPGELNGKPNRAVYTLTVNYELRPGGSRPDPAPLGDPGGDPLEAIEHAGWRAAIDRIAASNRQGDHHAALEASERLLVELGNDRGEDPQRAFAMALLQKALAHAGLGQEADALWYRDVARSMDPYIPGHDLAPYGRAGELLTSTPRPDPNPVDASLDPDRVKAPKLLRQVEPVFPARARALGIEGLIIVQGVVSETGEVHSPRVLRSLTAPVFAYQALEALKQFRFEPGKLDGEPHPVVYNLTINYKLTR
jgi:protein TonB